MNRPADGPAEEIIIGNTILEKLDPKVPTPEVIITPIYKENFFLSILIGAALFWFGHKEICQGQKKHPSKCLFHPDTPKHYFSRPKMIGLYRSNFKEPLDTQNPSPIRFRLYNQRIKMELVPDRKVKPGTLEFYC